MPLSKPAKRKLAHTRVVTCLGFERQDALWDIEGRIVDTKPFSFPNKDRGGRIEADEPLHDMSIRLTVDINLKVIDAEGVIEDSPYNYCKSVIPVVKQLVGLQIAPGWTANSKAAMGKNRGCTHLTELLGPIATTAIQTISSAKSRQASQANKRENEAATLFINACYALSDDSPVVKEHWPDRFQKRAIVRDLDSDKD